MKNMITLSTLLYKHFTHQEDLLEGITDTEQVQRDYDGWSKHCIITAIRPNYIKIELPNKTNALPISHYNDYKIYKGIWVAVGDYGRDIDEFHYCRNWGQALIRKWICRVRCTGPYLIHIINLK